LGSKNYFVAEFKVVCASHDESDSTVIRVINSKTGAVTGNDNTSITINGTSFLAASITGDIKLEVPAIPDNYDQNVISGQNALWVYADPCNGYSCTALPLFQLFCGIPSAENSLNPPIDGDCGVATFSNLISFTPGVGDYSFLKYDTFSCSLFVADGFSIRCVSFLSYYGSTGQVTTLSAYKTVHGDQRFPISFFAVGGSFRDANYNIHRPSSIFGYPYDYFGSFDTTFIYGFGALGLPQQLLSNKNSILGITADSSGNVFFSSGNIIDSKGATTIIADVIMLDTSGVLTIIASNLKCGFFYSPTSFCVCPMSLNPGTGDIYVSTLEGIIELSPTTLSSPPTLLTPLNVALISTTVISTSICVALFVLLYWIRASKLMLGSDVEMPGILSPSKEYALMSS